LKDLKAYLNTVSTVSTYKTRIDSFIVEVTKAPNKSAVEKTEDLGNEGQAG